MRVPRLSDLHRHQPAGPGCNLVQALLNPEQGGSCLWACQHLQRCRLTVYGHTGPPSAELPSPAQHQLTHDADKRQRPCLHLHFSSILIEVQSQQVWHSSAADRSRRDFPCSATSTFTQEESPSTKIRRQRTQPWVRSQTTACLLCKSHSMAFSLTWTGPSLTRQQPSSSTGIRKSF